MRRTAGDRADLGIGEMVLIFTGLVAAVGVYASFGTALSDDKQVHVAIVGDGPILNGVKIFKVTTATPGTEWGDLAFVVDGVPLRYDDTLSGQGVYCIQTGSGCLSASTWQRGDVIAGQSVGFRGAGFEGKTLRVLSPDRSTVIATAPFGG